MLGRGQQFAAYGRHSLTPSCTGSRSRRTKFGRDNLSAVTEAQIDAFLVAAAPIIGANETDARVATGTGILPHLPSVYGPSADPLDVAAALAAIPNQGPPDWEHWNRVGMATWAATGGSLTGFVAWVAWSERHPTHDPDLCRERWEHYSTSPPGSIGAGSLFHLAREARPDWVKPTDLSGDPAATLIEQARKAGQRSSENGDKPHDDTAGPANGPLPSEDGHQRAGEDPRPLQSYRREMRLQQDPRQTVARRLVRLDWQHAKPSRLRAGRCP